MNLLIQHIEYLISRNDCVIIPRLGALLAQYSPARVDEVSGMLYPPRRNFTFNTGLRDNDATVAHSISKATGMPFQRATDYVNKEVDSMMHQLHSFGSLSLGKAGNLRYSASDDIYEFVPFADDRLSVATSWLPVVNAQQLTMAVNDTDTTTFVSQATRPIWSKVGRIAAVVALFIGIWFVASTPVSHDDKSMLTASLAPDINRATSTPAIITATQKAIAPESVSDHETEYISDAAQQTEVSLPAPAQSDEVVSDEISVREMSHGRFYIIVGATVSAKEARKFIELHPDIKDQAIIVRYGKKHVIAVSVHDTPEDANSACLDARRNYPAAWIGTN